MDHITTPLASACLEHQKLRPDLRVAFILMNQFALAPVSGLVESLRFAADHAYDSQQLYCQWDWMTLDNQPVLASCGLLVTPTTPFNPFNDYDYVVLAGGLLSETRDPPAALLLAIQDVHLQGIPIITLCSASFVLGRLGLLDGRQCAIHWALKDEFQTRFPKAIGLFEPTFIEDQGIFTCPGGTAIELATHIIRKNCGNVRAQKGLAFLLVEPQLQDTSEDNPPMMPSITYENQLVDKAIDFMKQNLGSHMTLKQVAEHVHSNPRQLHRAFIASTHEAPAIYWRRLRLDYARNLLANTNLYITHIAMDCGFSDASHFILCFKKQYGETPFAYRKRRHHVEKVG